MIKRFEGKTAFITGGSSGIGFGIAQALIERGAQVALIGTDAGKLDRAVARLTELGGKVIGLQLDVANHEAWPAVVAEVERSLGPIDMLVLNAGAQGGRQNIETISAAEWRWVWSVNVDGIYNGLAACLPGMKARGSAAQVLITASIAALTPRPLASAYGAAKAAALALAESVRLELKDSPIKISVLCPAGVKTAIAETMARHAPEARADTFNYMQPVLAGGLDPLDVGRYTLDAMAAGHFYIFTHPEFAATVTTRHTEIQAAFRDQETAAQALKMPQTPRQ